MLSGRSSGLRRRDYRRIGGDCDGPGYRNGSRGCVGGDQVEVKTLLPHHREHLRLSGLTDQTIKADGYYSETNPVTIGRLLNWSRAASSLGSCLVVRFRHSDGSFNGFARVRPDRPRRDDKGAVVKYEQPRGVSPRAFFPMGALPAIADPAALLGLVEGEKKGSAATQAGRPAIGLCGVFSWQAPRTKDDKGKPRGERRLIEDLAAISWDGRQVWIGNDLDQYRNPNVNLAGAELARVLTDLGAHVVLLELPPGPRGPDGLPSKMAVDDFIFHHGEAAFRELVENALAPKPEPVGLNDYRSELVKARMKSLDCAGLYLDRSPTGAGKTYSDIEPMEAAGTSLTILQSHRGCRETSEMLCGKGLLAAAYPQLNTRTCQNYELATRAIEAGLSASSAVCPDCPFRGECDYAAEMAEAEAAPHRIATHRRAALSFESIARGRKYIAIHEDPTDLLRPMAETAAGFDKVSQVARHVKDREWELGDDDARYFFSRMEDAAHELVELLGTTNTTCGIRMSSPAAPPQRHQARLLAAMTNIDVWTPAEALRIVLAVAAGDLAELSIRVDTVLAPGRQPIVHRAVVAVWQTKIPAGATCWIADATAKRDEIELLAGQPVTDCTPGGRLAAQHPVVQIPSLDIKKGTAPSRVAAILRAVLLAFSSYSRVGIILDKRHVPIVQGTSRSGANLEECFRRRITKVEHYRGGASRGSNTWIDDCDLLLVAGTPRVPPAAVGTRLIQAGNAPAAARDGRWERDCWSGLDTAGRRHTVATAAYRDHDWHAAHQAVVHAELIQAIGRGRSILESGIPVVVLSNENLGFPVYPNPLEPMPEMAVQALQVVGRLSGQFPTGAETPQDPELSDLNPT